MGKTRRIVLALIIAAVVILTFLHQYASLIRTIENTAKDKEGRINKYIDLSCAFIDLVTIYGNDFLKYGKAQDDELYKYLRYDPLSDTYDLDAIEATEYHAASGNLTGAGDIPGLGIYRNEVNLALHLNKDFSSIYNKLPDVAWVYYTSKNDFINIYPFVPSADFSFSEVLQAEQFYTCVLPENNPLRESVWTPVYLDHAGKGLMVTLSSPIYWGNVFMGAVSLDLTNNMLSEIIESPYETYIIDETDSVIAAGPSIRFEEENIKLDALLQSSQDELQKLKEVRSGGITQLGMYFIYPVSFQNAPWKMFVRVPIWHTVGQAVLYTLPTSIICALLLMTFYEVEKRRKTELQLKTSLQELTSYQTLLENAAKYDFLTATVNRRGLIDIYNKNIETDRKAKGSVFFIMGDIDCFKQFNDTFGHAAGDKVLKEIAAIMLSNTKKDDVVCRWGGEEFVVMLLGRTREEALLIAESIRKEIETAVIPWDNAVQLRATMTFGLAEHALNESMMDSISRADEALYTGKMNGRNQVVLYHA